MDELFDTWCEATEEIDQNKTLWRATEKLDGRSTCIPEIARRVRSHYSSDEEISEFLAVLGFEKTADVLATLYPEGPKGRSADLGEIFGTEIIEEWCDHDVPIRKLRDKDHREQAMRGEDIIGVKIGEDDELYLLKGEAKSARSLSTSTVEEARASLEANAGRPTAHGLMFTARRLLGSGSSDDRDLGARVLTEVAHAAVPKSRLAHCFFAFTGNAAGEMLDDDFTAADGSRGLPHARPRSELERLSLDR
ncbi:MAG: Hachiman antiphage defense system protein HamA, partial [Pseudomonadota bacterium]